MVIWVRKLRKVIEIGVNVVAVKVVYVTGVQIAGIARLGGV